MYNCAIETQPAVYFHQDCIVLTVFQDATIAIILLVCVKFSGLENPIIVAVCEVLQFSQLVS